MRSAVLACSLLLSGMPAGLVVALASRPPADADEALLRDAKVPVGPRKLTQFLRDQCGPEADAAKVAALIRQLGASEFNDREDASKRLAALRALALPWMDAAQRDRDPEVAARASKCIWKITQHRLPHVLAAAVRWLVRQRADGASATLLRFLPYAVEQQLQEDVWFGLDAIAGQQKTLDPVFRATLGDKVAIRRAAAAYVLGRRGKERDQQLARKALADADPVVRLRAAQGLLARQDRMAVPVLIDLLEPADVETAWQAEDLLHWLAGNAGPAATIRAGAAEERPKCRSAWRKWWDDRGAKVDLEEPIRTFRRPGLVLVFEWNTGPHGRGMPQVGSLWLCGCDGRARWRLDGLGAVLDAHLIPGPRLLLAERRSGTRLPRAAWFCGVAERHLNGRIVWQYECGHPFIGCGHLADGATVVVDLKDELELVVLTPGGRPESDFSDIRRQVVRAARKGIMREVERSRETRWPSRRLKPGDVRYLPTGGILVADETPFNGRFLEVGQEGQVVWEAFPLKGDSRLVRPCLNLVRLGFDFPRPAHFDLERSIAYRIKGLNDPEARVRRGHAKMLGHLGTKAEPAVGALLSAQDDVDEDVRIWARKSVDLVTSPASLATLVCATKDKRPRVRAAACDHLWKYASQGRPGVDALVICLRDDPGPAVREQAASSLRHYKVHASLVVPALAKAIEDNGPGGRHGTHRDIPYTAVESLRMFGKQGQPAIPALLKAAKSRDSTLRAHIMATLGHLSLTTPAIKMALEEGLRDENEGVRHRAKAALERLRQLSKE
jgi:HEAT repeat protein